MKAFPTASPLKILGDDEVRDIHTATLEILERTGVVIREENALALLEQAGAAVDYATKRVRIPGRLVEEAVSKTPKSFVWHARNPKNDIRVGGEPTRFGPVSGGVNILDLETGECRAPTLRDTEQQVKLIDALENISHNYPPASHRRLDGALRHPLRRGDGEEHLQVHPRRVLRKGHRARQHPRGGRPGRG
jgi:trimethylamine:corrinoid methyltransferase-like protein